VVYETLQLEIITVLEALGQLRESPEFELCQISEKKPGVLDELAAERATLLEKESAELEKQAQQLARKSRSWPERRQAGLAKPQVRVTRAYTTWNPKKK